ncbi:MAG: hypothetical protein V1774_01600 [Candidatus Eisenbacteria bacterium]
MNVRNASFAFVVCATLVYALAAPTQSAWANVVIDPSFETQTAPFLLPGLAGIVGPVFTPGFWGAEFATVVTAESLVTPRCETQMLRMENEGGAVTQAFQAVYVGADSICIDNGLATVTLEAWLNTTELAGVVPVEGGVTVFFYSCDTCWGNVVPFITDPISLDNSPGTWEVSSTAGVIPPGTRWLLVQMGFTDASLLGRPGYVDCVQMEIDTSDCAAVPADVSTWGRVKELYR